MNWALYSPLLQRSTVSIANLAKWWPKRTIVSFTSILQHFSPNLLDYNSLPPSVLATCILLSGIITWLSFIFYFVIISEATKNLWSSMLVPHNNDHINQTRQFGSNERAQMCFRGKVVFNWKTRKAEIWGAYLWTGMAARFLNDNS